MAPLHIAQKLRLLRLGFAVAGGLLALIGLLLITGATDVPQVVLALGPRYVAPGGEDDGNDCTDSGNPCKTIQHAVDVADAGDEIRVATGVYTDVHVRPRADIVATGLVTQVVYISKTLTVRGGYTTTDWSISDPISYPTMLDAQRRGRVIYVTGDTSPVIEGLRIIRGNAVKLGGDKWGDVGGGVYVISATVTLSRSQVLSNTGNVAGGGLYILRSNGVLIVNSTIGHNDNTGVGGGLYLRDCPDSILTANAISRNRAGRGAGLYLWNSPNAALADNVFSENWADVRGGGLCIWSSSNVVLTGNQIVSNTVFFDSNQYNGEGGGLRIGASDNVSLIDNIIQENYSRNDGGGVYVIDCENIEAVLNTIETNQSGEGGGVYIASSDNAEWAKNVIRENWAYNGSGIYSISSDGSVWSENIFTGNKPLDLIWDSEGSLNFKNSLDVNLSGNMITGNGPVRVGGGLYLDHSDATIVNSIVADNEARMRGGGIYAVNSSPSILHTTVVRNYGADGSGIYVTGSSSTVSLTNTILVSHTVGITVADGNEAVLDGVLWHNNTANQGGEGTITVTNECTGDPAFAADGYHLTASSAAIDKADYGADEDIDGQPRPMGGGYDLGADEVPVVDFSASSYRVSEREGTATITVTLSAASAQAVAVDFGTHDGTAQAGQDYTAVNSRLLFVPGAVAQTFVVDVLDDRLDENDETVTLTLSNAINAVLGGANNPATLAIGDDDWTLFLPLVMRAYLGGVEQR